MFEAVIVMFIVLLALFAYFLPAILAEVRGHQNSGMIFLTNLLLGWTIVGWIVALVWAATAVQPRNPRGAASMSSIAVLEKRLQNQGGKKETQ
jgi:hypothetical protein